MLWTLDINLIFSYRPTNHRNFVQCFSSDFTVADVQILCMQIMYYPWKSHLAHKVQASASLWQSDYCLKAFDLCNTHLCDQAHTALALPSHLARADHVRWSKIWSWGRQHALIQALQSTQPLCRLGKQVKGNSFILLRVSFIQTAPAKTAMTSLSLFFLPSVTMCQHCLQCVGARLVSSACKAIFMTLHAPHAFLRVSHAFLFKVLNIVDLLQWLTSSVNVSICSNLVKLHRNCISVSLRCTNACGSQQQATWHRYLHGQLSHKGLVWLGIHGQAGWKDCTWRQWSPESWPALWPWR